MTSSELAEFGKIGASLQRTLDADRISPSYLFEGPDLQVLEELARSFATAILLAGQPEDEHEETRRRVAEDTHPDFHVRGKDKATVISVAALTRTLEQAQGTPVRARRQVFVIAPAEAMEPEGVARYLKILEEPPSATVFVLLSMRPDRLPQAVMSRVRRLRVPPLGTEVIAARLAEETGDVAQAQRIARWAGASLTRARRIARVDLVAVVDQLVEVASDLQPRTAAATDAVVGILQRAADAETEAAGEEKSARREHLRLLLSDVVQCLAVEARDVAATQPSRSFAAVPSDAGLTLLEDLGRLAAAVPANVTPAVVVLEALRSLRKHLAASGIRSHPDAPGT